MTIKPIGSFIAAQQARAVVRQTAGAAPMPPVFSDGNPLSEGDRQIRPSSTYEPSGAGLSPVPGVEKPAVVKMPSSNHNPRQGGKIDTVVLHHTAGEGTAEDVGRYFQRRDVEVSSHYVIGKDGVIVQPVEDAERAWHAGVSQFQGRRDVNDFSIGIEIVNRGDGQDPYTDEQYRALAKLVNYLQKAYGISWERITGHKDIALPKGRKSDPSPNFDYERLKHEVEALQAPHFTTRSTQQEAKTAPAVQPAPAAVASAPAAQPATYAVRKGDTLARIARSVLGDAKRWPEIYTLNRDLIGANPNLIFPGQTLKLPTPAPIAPPAPAPAPVSAPSVMAELMALQQEIATLEAQLAALSARAAS